MVNVLYLMPHLFDLYFYESYELDDWWYGAYTKANQRSDEESWWNEVQWYDEMLRDDGTKDKIQYYLDLIMERNMDFESIASEIYN